MPENDSGERHVAGNETILRTVAARFMQTMAARFAETCQKFGISEETAGALLTGTLLLDEPANAEAFEVAWSDVYDETLAATEAEHGVKIETDSYYVEVVEIDTGESVMYSWGGDLVADG